MRVLSASLLALLLAACAPKDDGGDDTDGGDTDTVVETDETDDTVDTLVPPDAPAAPTSVVAHPSSTTSIRVSWVDVSDDEGFFGVTYRPSGGAWAWAPNVPENAVTFEVTGLTPGTTYEVRVQACTDDACSAWAGPASATTPVGAVPASPDNLTVVVLGTTSLGIDWRDNSDDETGFVIATSTDGGRTFVDAGELAANTVSVDDVGIASNTEFCYRVRARNAAGDSAPSNIGCGTTDPVAVPGAPTGVQATLTNATQILLTWTNPIPNDGYKIYESVGGGAFVFAGTVAGGNRPGAYVDGLSAGATYAYKVVATNERGDSAQSLASNSVTTPAAPAPTATRFVNASVYPMVSLKVDGVELFPAAPQAIPPGGSITVTLAAGSHTYAAESGFWSGSSRETLYTWSGTYTQQSNQIATVAMDDPTVGQLLARLSPSALFTGEYWQDLVIHTKSFRFLPNGTYTHYVDGVAVGTGTVAQVTYGGNFLLTFQLSGAVSGQAILDERVGTFWLRNGPSDWPTIQYGWDGP